MADQNPKDFATSVALAAQQKLGDRRKRHLTELGRRVEGIARQRGFTDPNRFLAQFSGAATVSEPEPVETIETGDNWTDPALRFCEAKGLEPKAIEDFIGKGSGKDGKITKADVEAYLELNWAE